MKKNSYLLILVTILTLSSVLTGCSPDSHELDDQVYALVIGVDKGVDNKVRITIQYPTYKGDDGKGGGGGGESGGKEDKTSQVGNTVVSTVEAPSILEAVDIMNMSVMRRISLVHTKVIIFSEDFAKEGIGSFLQPIARFREMRREVQILVCKGKAEDFIRENETLVGQGLAKALELKIAQSDNTGFFPRAPFVKFYRSVISPYNQAFAIYAGTNDYSKLKPIDPEKSSPLNTEKGLLPGEVPRKGDIKNEFAGTAIFNGDKMVGALDSYETRYFLMVTGKFKRGIMTIEDKNAPGQAVVLDIRPGRKPKVEAYFEGDKPVIDVNLSIEADIISVQSRYPYEDPEKMKDLNEQIKKSIQKGVEKVIEKSQKKLKSDVFDFGYKVASNFSSIKDFEDYKWHNHYPDAEVNIDVQTNVRRTGLMIMSSPIIYSETIDSSEAEN